MNRVNEIMSRRNTLLLVALLACTAVWNAIWAINFFIATTWYNGVFTIYCNNFGEGYFEVAIFILMLITAIYLIVYIFKNVADFVELN